ncbi:DUF2523 family protein [Photobacterium ganghwense]|uniref:DUF2523 family protein n=1 Tax=Photobacterium ganghwense TaxID=320778 RepID=UPI0039EE1010
MNVQRFALILLLVFGGFASLAMANEMPPPPTPKPPPVVTPPTDPGPTNPGPIGGGGTDEGGTGEGGSDSGSALSDSLVTWFVGLINEFWAWFEHSPTFFERMFAYLIEFAVYVKFYLFLQTLEFAHGVAQALISNIGLDSLVSDAIGGLSSEHRQVFAAFGVLKAITIMMEAAVTRFVLNFMGW